MGDMEPNRRSLLMAAAPLLLAAVAAGDKPGNIGELPLARAPDTGPGSQRNVHAALRENELPVLGQPAATQRRNAVIYGGSTGILNQPGPYVVMMKSNPGWFSAQHFYAISRRTRYRSGPAVM